MNDTPPKLRSALSEVGHIAGILTVGAVVVFGIFYVSSFLSANTSSGNADDFSNASAELEFVNYECPFQHPVKITIKNSGSKNINFVQYRITAVDQGRSSIYSSTTIYHDDKIINPQMTYVSCIKAPSGIPQDLSAPKYSVEFLEVGSEG